MAMLGGGADGRGVALTGASGVGKSTLARVLAAALAAGGRQVRFVLGTETGRAVPLGAFSRAVRVAGAEEPAVILAEAYAELAQDDDLVLVVDDAHLLDPLSAMLVHQVTTGGVAHLIVTIGPGEPAPEAVTALLSDRRLRCLHLEPFDREQTALLAGAVLGDVVDDRLIDELFRCSGGNALFLRGLLSAGPGDGALVHAPDGWHLGGQLRPDRELEDLLELRLRALAPDELDTVETLAVAELLDWRILRTLCRAEAVARLERRGVIQIVADGSDLLARLIHPVVGEAALRRAGRVRVRELNGALAVALREHLGYRAGKSRLPDVRGRIRLAQYMMHSDLDPDVDVLVAAAASALTMAMLEYAEEFARFAWDHDGGLRAALVLAETLSWQGRGAEAEALLAEAQPDEQGQWQRWARARVSHLYWGCGRLDAAREALVEATARATGDQDREALADLRVSLAFFSGDLGTAIDAGLALRSDVRHRRTRAWQTMTTSTAWALGLAGRFDEARRVIDTELRRAGVAAVGMQRLATGLAELTTYLEAGDLIAADRVSAAYGSGGAGSSGGDVVQDAIRGLVDLARGAVRDSCAALAGAVSVLKQGFPDGWVMLVAAWCAQAQGASGDSAAAAAALYNAEQDAGPQVAVFAPELELARAWRRAGVGETTAARSHAVRGAQMAHRAGMIAVEARALHTAVRFGDRSLSGRLTELADRLGTEMAAVCALQARGLADHRGDLLDAASARFQALGAMALAADAAAQAAGEHARCGRRSGALAAAHRAHVLAEAGGLDSPAVRAAARPLPISAREREIAELAMTGLSNRLIAERLSVSVRTVDGHLYRIFAKLGIAHRDELTRLLGGRNHGDENVALS
ncbi:helix-turn-helix transcriptional regulator [Mycolicibacillus parakoreensis]|uniref:Helix-turn-helix transcriptional regulator n=2 Tax=Mycolicibacillus parakoreensis TaxID=1069221 RepID=A0ABY3U3K6_9MYCO|nr:helix-turn-helix transcriptional regulator [Mycolicibacillus parakoreensis]ULN54540.1 helix-turn-helix transcriptional regulator [Mycolicibacillus parakoreensis]